MDYPLSSFLEVNLETPPPSIIFQETHLSYKLAALHYGVCVFVPVCVIEQKGIRMFYLYFDCAFSVQKAFVPVRRTGK